MRLSRALVTGSFLFAALTLAACGDDDDFKQDARLQRAMLAAKEKMASATSSGSGTGTGTGTATASEVASVPPDTKAADGAVTVKEIEVVEAVIDGVPQKKIVTVTETSTTK